MFGTYFVEKEDDLIIKSHFPKLIKKNLPKLSYYKNESNEFKVLDYNFETYNQLIDQCKLLLS